MDSKQIEELLAKYWECETSLEDEQQLRAYFDNRQIPENLKEAASLFKYFSEQKKKSLNDIAFNHQVVSNLNKPGKGRVIKLLYNTMRIAAGIAVLMVAVWFVRTEIRRSTPPELIDTYDDPHLAFEETKKALLIISRSFGRAEEQAKKINVFNEAQKQIQGEEEIDEDSKNL